VKEELAAEMEKASDALDFERAAIYRDRLAALRPCRRIRASIHAAWRRPTCSRCIRRAASSACRCFLPHRSELG
jgi:hypothetical protein